MTPPDDRLLNAGLHEMFAHQATRRPDAVAVRDGSGSISYRVLSARAHAIAALLMARGLQPEQPVGVLMSRTADLIAVLLGILQAGGCYVPLDPDDPPERNRRIVSGAACDLVLGQTTLLEPFRAHLQDSGRRATLIPVEPGCGLVANNAGSPASQASAPGGRRLAYILFTSGSTGAPKGVEVEHRSVVNLLLAMREWFAFSESDRYLAISTLGFDISVAEIFLPLITGATMVLRDRKLLMEPRRLAEEIRSEGVTVFQTGPSVWSILLDEVPEFPKVRVAITTGEAIPPALALRLADRGERVWNLYGPTETTVWATGHRLDRDARAVPTSSKVSAPIGLPLPNLEARVLDEQRQPVAPGVEGELWIGGEGVARGYCRNPQLTQERFQTLGADGGRFYRTGDVVLQDAQGILHYFGRNDDQIKVRGVRIEPMEVESALLSHPGVAQVAATWFEASEGSRSIVAGVVPKPNVTLTASDLHAHSARRLTPAMIPSRFVFLDALPQTPSGKVDRKAIRARAAAPAPSVEAAPESGMTETERRLKAIWESTLNLRPIRRTDHFFTIGGDSLSAVTMMLEVESFYGITLPVRVIFEVPTLDQFAARVDRVRGNPDDLGNATFIFPLSQQGRGNPVFFSSVDLRMAHRDYWTPDCPLYSIALWAQGSGFIRAGSLEELAAGHIERIRAIQPRGPYRLAGYSFGGLVALEMAQQLRAAGETVEMLFLLDPSSHFGRETWFEARTRRLRRPGLSSSPVPKPGRLARLWLPGYERVRGVFASVWQWLNYWIVHLHGRSPNPVSTRILPRNRWPAFWYVAKRLGRSYVPRPYDGPAIAVFVAREHQYEAWKKLLGSNAELQVIQADHLELFAEPARSAWLQPLKARLDGTPSSFSRNPRPTPVSAAP
ncbi:MAG: amino acid adenylation domain-containing protein [Verrucomicrobiales bacterium]|nr:amino acid adenylation domain-containing protein [Verrucomicrobiales bacterium]